MAAVFTRPAARCDLGEHYVYLAENVGEDVEALASDSRYARRYAEFQRDMVYGDPLAYRDALVTISALAEQLPEASR